MVGITVGVGEAYRVMATRSAQRLEQLCGISTYIFTEDDARSLNVSMPQFLKFYIFDVTDDADVLFFDPDVITINAYDPLRFVGLPELICVRDLPNDFGILEANFLGFSPANYFNAGWFIANRHSHAHLFDECKHATEPLISLWQSGDKRRAIFRENPADTIFHDQAILNHIAFRSTTPLRLLDWRYNFLLFGEGDLGIHVKNLFSVHLLSNKKCFYDALYNGEVEKYDTLEVCESQFVEIAGHWAHFYAQEWKCDIWLREDGTIVGWPYLHYWFIDVRARLVVSEYATIRLVMYKQACNTWTTSDGLAQLHRA